MNIHSIYRPFLLHFRAKRIRKFYSLFQIDQSTTVLDLGGNTFFWRLAETKGLKLPSITIVNLYPPDKKLPKYIQAWVVAGQKFAF
jgi:hypothetical protein